MDKESNYCTPIFSKIIKFRDAKSHAALSLHVEVDRQVSMFYFFLQPNSSKAIQFLKAIKSKHVYNAHHLVRLSRKLLSSLNQDSFVNLKPQLSQKAKRFYLLIHKR